jgi:hypothetical protein
MRVRFAEEKASGQPKATPTDQSCQREHAELVLQFPNSVVPLRVPINTARKRKKKLHGGASASTSKKKTQLSKQLEPYQRGCFKGATRLVRT